MLKYSFRAMKVKPLKLNLKPFHKQSLVELDWGTIYTKQNRTQK